jgi:hypothetical protein
LLIGSGFADEESGIRGTAAGKRPDHSRIVCMAVARRNWQCPAGGRRIPGGLAELGQRVRDRWQAAVITPAKGAREVSAARAMIDAHAPDVPAAMESVSRPSGHVG